MSAIGATRDLKTLAVEVKEEVKGSKWLTKAKVIEFGKKFFSELIFWGTAALIVTAAVIVIKLAFAHPIFSIAGIVLGFLAYRNRNKIGYIATMYRAVFRDFLGLSKWHNDINSNIVLGAIPLENKGHPKAFKDAGITDILCLSEDFELKTKTFISTPVIKETWVKEGINFKHLPTSDFLEVPMKIINEAVSFIDEVVKRNGKVYVHCKSGKGVSSTVVIGYLMKYQGLTAKQAIANVKAKRPSIQLNTAQLGRVYEYELFLESTRPKSCVLS